MEEIKNNDNVKVHYTGKLESGQVFDTSENREPLEFTIGEGKLIPGFEKGVVGMKKGDKKEIKIPFEEAYGSKREELVYEIEKKHLPEDIDPKVGMQLMSKSQEGHENVVFVKEVKDNSIVIDANHPLAGKNLIFEIEVVEVN